MRVVRHADIHQAANIGKADVCRMKVGVLNAVSIDLPNIQILLNLLHFVWDDVIGSTPYLPSFGKALLTRISEHVPSETTNELDHEGSPRRHVL